MSFLGWTCQKCWAYVPSGSAHSCPPSAYASPVPTVESDLTFQWLALGDRLATALERIIDLLEKEKP